MMRRWLNVLIPFAASFAMSSAHAQSSPLQLYAAGSLRDALTDVARQFEAQTGQTVVLTFGASGLLRERIEKGEAAQVFASADMDHPQQLAQAGGWTVPSVFALNQMCVLAAPSVTASPQTLLATMLRPDVRVGTSTPKADPSGDYAWALFRRAEVLHEMGVALLGGGQLGGTLRGHPHQTEHFEPRLTSRLDQGVDLVGGASGLVRLARQVALDQHLSARRPRSLVRGRRQLRSRR